MNTFTTTFIENNFDTRRKLANRVLRAFKDIQGYSNGTINNPCELAQAVLILSTESMGMVEIISNAVAL